jgi:hypothetical protein
MTAVLFPGHPCKRDFKISMGLHLVKYRKNKIK